MKGLRSLGRRRSLLAVCLLILAVVGSCAEDEFQASQSAGGGAIAVNEGNFGPLQLPGVAWNVGPATTTITLSGSYFNPDTLQNEFPVIVLIVPNGLVFNPIDLETTGSTFTDSSFVTNSVSGEVTLFEVSISKLSGVLDATFTDATDNTREVVNVQFVINDFNTRP